MDVVEIRIGRAPCEHSPSVLDVLSLLGVLVLAGITALTARAAAKR
jgi:hypothetical protein